MSPIDNAALLDAFWAEVADAGWRATTLDGVAFRAGLPRNALRGRIRCLFDLLKLHGETIDAAVVAALVPDAAASPRDRVFDAVMQRLDLMQPHRAGITRLLSDLKSDPLTALGLAACLPASMARMLDAAGIETRGPLGVLRVKGLSAVWLYTVKAWREDDSMDLTGSMAALDRALERAEQFGRGLRLPVGDIMATDTVEEGGMDTPSSGPDAEAPATPG